ncbi:uncharacterized protein [Miscanthus floridulus]|uniref:uncharacterized protein isoform X1 n=1 Tax=Miscanthus floridulus TaxID=154761 RepID=UPI00345A093E
MRGHGAVQGRCALWRATSVSAALGQLGGARDGSDTTRPTRTTSSLSRLILSRPSSPSSVPDTYWRNTLIEKREKQEAVRKLMETSAFLEQGGAGGFVGIKLKNPEMKRVCASME